jgi:hypothetical protein
LLPWLPELFLTAHFSPILNKTANFWLNWQCFKIILHNCCPGCHSCFLAAHFYNFLFKKAIFKLNRQYFLAKHEN